MSDRAKAWFVKGMDSNFKEGDVMKRMSKLLVLALLLLFVGSAVVAESGITNRGKYKMLAWSFRGVAVETNTFIVLVTAAQTPTADTDSLSHLTEITAGNGYTTGGYSLTPGNTDFDVWTEDDVNDWALLQVKNVVWTANGGSIPDSGEARWAVLTDDNGTIADREVYAWFDLVSGRSVSDGQTLTLENCELRLTAP